MPQNKEIPDLHEALADTWAKACTLKAQANVVAVDPERELFLDMLLKFPGTNAWLYQDQKELLDQEEEKFYAFLMDRTGEETSPVELLRQRMRENFFSRAVGIAVSHATLKSMGENAGSDPAADIQEALSRTDPEFQIWMGNAYEEQRKRMRENIRAGLEPD